MGENKSSIKTRIAKLIDVKSLVTLTLTIVFAYMCIVGKASTDFITIYTMIIAFYFGVQATKGSDNNG